MGSDVEGSADVGGEGWYGDEEAVWAFSDGETAGGFVDVAPSLERLVGLRILPSA